MFVAFRIVFWIAVVAAFLFNLFVYLRRAQVLQTLPPCDELEEIGAVRSLLAFLEEWAATVFVLVALPVGWLQAMANRSRIPSTSRRGPIVLVHGWGLNGGSFWLLRRRLQRDGWNDVYCLDYRSWFADIDTAARQLGHLVDSLGKETGEPITLIGHSLGGLVLRAYARNRPHPRVRRLVTLGTPHRGTELARGWLPALAPESTALTKLDAGDQVPRQFDVIAVNSSFDAVILPPSHATYAGSFNIQLDNVGHNALLTSKRVYDLIAENLTVPIR